MKVEANIKPTRMNMSVDLYKRIHRPEENILEHIYCFLYSEERIRELLAYTLYYYAKSNSKLKIIKAVSTNTLNHLGEFHA